MLVCDRCRDKAKYNVYVGGKYHDICDECNRKLDEIQKVFNDVENSIMLDEFDVIKHIDFERSYE